METSTSPKVEGVTKVILLPFTHHTSLIARPCDRVRPGNEAITLSVSLKCKILSVHLRILSVYFKDTVSVFTVSVFQNTCQYVSGYSC